MDFQILKYQNSEPNPAASYPSPRTESQSSPTPSSPIYEQSRQVQAPQSLDPLSTGTEYMDPMRAKVTDDDLERLEGDARDHDAVLKPRKAPPLPEEHIYVHDPQFPLNLTDFEVMETLGTGTFGRVLLVRLRSTSPHAQPGVQQHFAMKVLRKTEVVRLRQVAHVQAERFILSRIQHPFIVDLYATFSDPFNVYMLLSYVPGGELFSHLRRAGRFTPDVTRFYLAGIVLALRYLHGYNIIYRDLKPENLLLDHRGYLRIADFGFSKIVDDRTWTLCGTPEYLAPEIIQSSGHGKAVDWWACGILTYEMLVGYPPFFDDNPFGIYEKILRGKIHWPKEMDHRSRELIKGFLNPDRSKRLGNLRGGADDVLSHDWFRGVDWVALERGEIRAPLIPVVTSSADTRNFTNLPLPDPSDLPGLIPSLTGRLHEIPDSTGDLFANF